MQELGGFTCFTVKVSVQAVGEAGRRVGEELTRTSSWREPKMLTYSEIMLLN